jgi:hypothetical protein
VEKLYQKDISLRYGGPEKPWNILHMLAITGISTALELFQFRGHYECLTSLCKGGLVEKKLVAVHGKIGILLVKLTGFGGDFCREKGWSVVESEWSFMNRLHPNRTDSERHTAAVLWFAGLARFCDWKVVLLPKGFDPFLKPDLYLEKEGEVILGEVETRPRDRYEKWRSLGQLAAHKGCRVGICALSKSQRSLLVEECRRSGMNGLATDLQTLSENIQSNELWWEEFHRIG